MFRCIFCILRLMISHFLCISVRFVLVCLVLCVFYVLVLDVINDDDDTNSAVSHDCRCSYYLSAELTHCGLAAVSAYTVPVLLRAFAVNSNIYGSVRCVYIKLVRTSAQVFGHSGNTGSPFSGPPFSAHPKKDNRTIQQYISSIRRLLYGPMS